MVTSMSALPTEPFQALEVRMRGRVQGVGLRPTLWRMAREFGLVGEVLNDSEGVLLRIGGDRMRVAAFLDRIESRLPLLACVDSVETRNYASALSSEFRIAESSNDGVHTQIAPDAAICAACISELLDNSDRRYRYPFITCTHCGPRLSIVARVYELREFFEWRGLGSIDHSGVKMRGGYARFDAERRFALPNVKIANPKSCQCGEVLKGVIKPWQCKVFGTACTPEKPLGALMVSSEGACAAYYQYGGAKRQRNEAYIEASGA